MRKESYNRREAKKGQGMKSLVRGMGMKSPIVTNREAKISGNRSGAEGDNYDSDQQQKNLYGLRRDSLMLYQNQKRRLRLLFDSCFFWRFAHWGYIRAAALKPAWGFHPQTPSSLRGGYKFLTHQKLPITT